MEPLDDVRPSLKIMKLRYDGACACGAVTPRGTKAGWDRAERKIMCVECIDAATAELPILEAGMPGASLRAEYEGRRVRWEADIRREHPRLGGLILALRQEPATTRAFAVGADGEERLASRLAELCGDDVLFLHNRRRGIGSRLGDIDHIAIASQGVFVIDAKAYRGAKVRVRRVRGEDRLMVRGRNRTKLVNSVETSVVAVSAALASSAEWCDVPVVGIFCFLDADLPMFGTPEIRGFDILGPRSTGRTLRREGPYDAAVRDAVWRHLAAMLPSA